MEINTSQRDDLTVVEIRGRIVDGEPAEQLHKVLRGLVAEKKSDTIFDLSGVEWFDSVAIGNLVCHYISISKVGGRILILNASDKIKKLMEIVHLEDRFGWADNWDEALAWFNSQ
jgi:anti-anti-sigma factor